MKAAEAAERCNEDETMHILYVRTDAKRLLAFVRLMIMVVVLLLLDMVDVVICTYIIQVRGRNSY